ncbi:MAG: twin-arginine translocase TatA/TatE family subunit [Sediminibacterium sp.]
MGLQGKEFIWIFLAIVILFGAKKIPDLMKGVGQGIREFKNASKGEESSSTPSESEKIENK